MTTPCNENMSDALHACAHELGEAERVMHSVYTLVRQVKEGLLGACRREHVIKARAFEPDRCICAEDTAAIGYLMDQPLVDEVACYHQGPLAPIIHDAFNSYLVQELRAHLPAMVDALKAGYTCVSLVFPPTELVYSYVDWPGDGRRYLRAALHRCFRDTETIAQLRTVVEATGFHALVNQGSIVLFAFTG